MGARSGISRIVLHEGYGPHTLAVCELRIYPHGSDRARITTLSQGLVHLISRAWIRFLC